MTSDFIHIWLFIWERSFETAGLLENTMFGLIWKQSSADPTAALTEGIGSFDRVWPLHYSYAVVQIAATLIIHMRRAINPQIRQRRIHIGSWTPAEPWKWASAITISHTMERASYITAGLWSFNSMSMPQKPLRAVLFHLVPSKALLILNPGTGCPAEPIKPSIMFCQPWFWLPNGDVTKPPVPKHFSMAASQKVFKENAKLHEKSMPKVNSDNLQMDVSK